MPAMHSIFLSRQMEDMRDIIPRIPTALFSNSRNSGFRAANSCYSHKRRSGGWITTRNCNRIFERTTARYGTIPIASFTDCRRKRRMEETGKERPELEHHRRSLWILMNCSKTGTDSGKSILYG